MLWSWLLLTLLIAALYRVGLRACAHHQERDRFGYCSWAEALRAQRFKITCSQPHHYFVAAGLSLLMIYFGHHSFEHHATAWGYALLENITAAGE